jgi:hypothetical protein
MSAFTLNSPLNELVIMNQKRIDFTLRSIRKTEELTSSIEQVEKQVDKHVQNCSISKTVGCGAIVVGGALEGFC